jgi:hypothetical protein
MSLTKRLASDQVLYRLYGGNPDSAAPVQEQDVQKALEQKINSKFRVRQLENMQMGETIPDGLCFATYTGVAVTADGDRSKSVLPVMPISLPRNMGVFDIRYNDNSFIPLQVGQRSLLKTDTLLNNLLNQVGYEPKGKTVYYTQNIALLGWTTVDMDLIVSDLSVLSDTDPLPIPASYEEELINELVAQFITVQPESATVNAFTTANQQTK